MKKYFALVLMAVAFAMPSKAQIKFGVQAGLNMTNVSTEDLKASVKSRTGFFVGPTVKFTLPIVGLGIDADSLLAAVGIESQCGGCHPNLRFVLLPTVGCLRDGKCACGSDSLAVE